jgi:hypothetical protein
MKAISARAVATTMNKFALISPCGKYRYRLGRRWSPEGCVLWIMLNPSTADANIDDRTIGRCMRFASDWGYGGILVGNLYPYRATKPIDLRGVDRWGEDNDAHIADMARECQLIVVAWGSNSIVSQRDVASALSAIPGRPLKCLGKTVTGAPLHPLFQPADAALIDYP